jgi:hypothetical protein
MKAEIRGRNSKWDVFYPDESGLSSPLPIYDREGNLKEVVEVGAPTDKLVEAYGSPFRSRVLAEEYARYLGATEITIVKRATRAEALKRARAARRAAA